MGAARLPPSLDWTPRQTISLNPVLVRRRAFAGEGARSLTAPRPGDRIGGYPIWTPPMTSETREAALRRLKIIAGQVDALRKQVEDDRYCVDVLDLSLSVQKALRSLDGLVMQAHLRTHVVDQMRGDEV